MSGIVSNLGLSVGLNLHLSRLLGDVEARTADSELKMVLCACVQLERREGVASWRLLAGLIHCVAEGRGFCGTAGLRSASGVRS